MFFSRFQCTGALLASLVLGALYSADLNGAEIDDSTAITRTETPEYKFTPDDEKLLDDIQLGCFNYLWNEVGKPGKLAKDRRTTAVASLAGVGFQLSSLPIAVKRGWITRQQGEKRALEILHTIADTPGNRHAGFLLHFVNADNGAIYPSYDNEVSSVDTALFVAGAIPAAEFFEGEVAKIVGQLSADVNWKEFQRSATGLISFGWKPDFNGDLSAGGAYMENEWHLATDEERLIYFIAAGTPNSEFAIDPASYYKLDRNVGQDQDGKPFVMSWNGLLFTYFFSHCWINYRDLAVDDPSQFGIDLPGVDWFENSRRGTLAHRQACINFAKDYHTLAEDRWGLSPCMGQKHDHPSWDYIVQELQPNIRKVDNLEKGTVAPYAAGSSIMFTPDESMAALRTFRDLKTATGQPLVWRDPHRGGYAFSDSFNLDQQIACDDNVAIDVGPMILAIENARTGMIWKLFMESDYARRASERLKLFPAR